MANKTLYRETEKRKNERERERKKERKRERKKKMEIMKKEKGEDGSQKLFLYSSTSLIADVSFLLNASHNKCFTFHPSYIFDFEEIDRGRALTDLIYVV